MSFMPGARIGLSKGGFVIAKRRGGGGGGGGYGALYAGNGMEAVSPPCEARKLTFNAISDPRREWHSNVKAPKNGTRTFYES